MPDRTLLHPPGIPAPFEGFTPGIRYGRWVFTSGINAGDYATGLVADARGNPAIPLAGEDGMILQARSVLGMLQTILAAGGSGLQHGARIDQFPTSRAMLDPYHIARREVMDPPRPASTSVHIPALLAPAATSQVELLAIIPEDGFRKEGISADIPQPLAGYSPALRVGDWVFLAGQVATDWKSGVAPEAQVDPRFWEGNRIDRETAFTLQNMKLTLEAAGSSMANVVKANVYLTDINDLPRMDRVWRAFFPDNPPARTVYPILSLGVAESRIEITFVAVTDDGATKKQIIDTKAARPSLFHQSVAVRAGEFLFLSGLLAADADGLVAGARTNPHYPYGIDSAEAQMRDILDQAQIICHAAGTDLSRALRMGAMLTGLQDYPATLRACAGRFPDGAPVTNVIGVPGPLQVPGCTVLADLWIAS
jgi:enamine deaminase RidA (YjgF/YER057c/UK114 family)